MEKHYGDDATFWPLKHLLEKNLLYLVTHQSFLLSVYGMIPVCSCLLEAWGVPDWNLVCA